VKPGDLVTLNEEARRRFPRMRDHGPWEVLKVSPCGVVIVRRISQTTGRPYRDHLAERFLDVVVDKEERRRT